MKKFTAMHLIKSIKENPQESRKGWMMSMFEKAGRQNSNNTVYQFWQQDNHPVQLKDENRFSRALEYIHNNPLASGIVRRAEDFPWSSAADYCGGKRAVDVVIY